MSEKASPLGRESSGLQGFNLHPPPLVENEVRHNIQKHTMPQENKAVKAIQATTL